MKTKEQLLSKVIELNLLEMQERILKQAQDELVLKGLECSPFYVSMVFHRKWAEICMSN